MTKPTEEDLRRAKDNLERVVTDQQRVLGVPDPGGRAVHEFITPILEKVARGPKEKAPAAPPAPKEEAEDVEITELGTYEWNLKTNEFAAVPGSYIPTAQDRLRLFIRWLLHNPETNATFLTVGRMCMKHTNWKKHCARCERREDKFRQVLRQCAVKYGYGQYAAPRKVVSLGAK